LKIVLPMVADVSDVRRARAIILEEASALRNAGCPLGELSVGAMIEVPSAVFMADKIARIVDFFELGTNDLVQYTLAVDRGNDEVADWFRTLHPAVLHSIDKSLKAGKQAGIPVIVCGEMASTPAYVVLLLGLGAKDLSMTPSSIPRVRRAIAGVDSREARVIVDECLNCDTADEVENLVRERFTQRWPDLFPPASLPQPRSMK
jgi:phosphotransferase system enzyme I (PtsI)